MLYVLGCGCVYTHSKFTCTKLHKTQPHFNVLRPNSSEIYLSDLCLDAYKCQIYFLWKMEFVFCFFFIVRKLWWWSDCRLDLGTDINHLKTPCWHLHVIAVCLASIWHGILVLFSGIATLIHYNSLSFVKRTYYKVIEYTIQLKPCNEMKRFDKRY